MGCSTLTMLSDQLKRLTELLLVLQVFPQVLSEMQPELFEERRQPEGYASFPGKHRPRDLISSHVVTVMSQSLPIDSLTSSTLLDSSSFHYYISYYLDC